MKKLHAILVSAAATGALAASSLTLAPAAGAATSSPLHHPTENNIPASAWIALEAAIDSRSQVFDGLPALRAGVKQDVVTDFATGWLASGHAIKNATVNTAEMAAIQRSTPTQRSCSGKNKADHTGLQYNYYLNSCNTEKLKGWIAAGVGASAIAAGIMAITGVGAAVAGIVAGALTLAGGIVSVCSANGKGIAAHILQFTNVVWCNNQ